MIITEIHAENFRKYKSLQLENLPECGVIAVIGGNESGKSSIGNAILFALFGCTEQLSHTEAHKLIHWNAEQASVSLRMHHRGYEYRLVRSIDKQGHSAATLFSTEEEITLADTSEGVERQLEALFGYNYATFSKSFYWGRQPNQPSQDNDTLWNIADLQESAQINEQLSLENQERHSLVEELEAKRNHTQGNLDALHMDTSQLPHVEKIAENIEQRYQQIQTLEQQLGQQAVAYSLDIETFRNGSQRNHTLSRWTQFSLIVFLISLLIGVSLLFAPEWWQNLLSNVDSDTLYNSGDIAIKIASASALLSAFFLVYGWYAEMRHMRPLQQRAHQLSQTLYKSYEVCTQSLKRQLHNDSIDYLVEKHIDLPDHSLQHEDLEKIPNWADKASRYETKVLYIHSAADTLHSGLKSRQKELADHRDVVQAEIDAEYQLRQHRDELLQLLQEQEDQLEYEHRQQVVYATALDLLKQDAQDAITRFNRLVKTRCPELLQRFTEGHYQSLEITSEFDLQVLSEEKGDYLDFNEISTGTQRQIALALQLALANAFTDATQADAQLLFLDEPFAFFDNERTHNTLSNLEESSRNSAINQIWLTSQNKPTGIKLSRIIQCQQNTDTLISN